MEEMKNFREREQTRQEVASKLERQFSNELGEQHSKNLCEASEFHCSPMQADVRYRPPHRRKGGTLENIVEERPNAVRAIAPQRIFAQTNPLT